MKPVLKLNYISRSKIVFGFHIGVTPEIENPKKFFIGLVVYFGAIALWIGLGSK